MTGRRGTAFAVALTLWLSACSKPPRPEDIEAFPVAQPGRAAASHQREYPGEVQALARVELRSRIKGRIESIGIDEGQRVEKGQRLFTIAARELQQERRRTRAAVASAAAELKTADLERLNTKMLLDKAVVSPAEMALAEAKCQLLAARQEEARAAESQAAVNLGYTEVRAPFAGVVNRLLKKAGSSVDEGELLTTLADTSEVLVYFRVSEQEYLEYASRKDDGRSKQVSIRLANGEMFPDKGVMDAVETEFDRNTGTIAFRARFPNPAGVLRHGGTGKVLVETRLDGALTIPQRATFEVQDHIYVYVVDAEGKARARRIVPKLRLGEVFVIEGGIGADERFIAEGVQKVKDGAPVAIRIEAPLAGGGPERGD